MRKKTKRWLLILAFAALFCFSLNFRPHYAETISVLRRSLISAFSGAALCCAGAIFQTAFKNPIAAPNLLGISTGVGIGNIAFVLTFQLAAYSFLPYRYIYCYALAILMVLLTVVCGRLTNRRFGGFSVEGMILAGMMITHLGQVVVQFFNYQLEADETGLVYIYTQISNGDILFVDDVSFTMFCVFLLLAGLPVILIRYRFNCVAFSDAEMKAAGVNNPRLRLVGLVCGSVMATVALIHCGDVGFLSMAVPFMARTPDSIDFRDVLFNSALGGGIISLGARTLLSFVTGAGYYMPVSVIITILAAPLFVRALIRRGDAFV